MSTYYYLYQSYEVQLYNAMIWLSILALFAVTGWYLVKLLFRDRARQIAQTMYLVSCGGIYALLITFFVRGL